MTHLALANIVLDVSDLDRASRFWCAALGYVEFARSGVHVALQHPTDARRFRIGFQLTDGAPVTSGGVHFDLETDDRDAEVARLAGLGAARVEDWKYPLPDAPWTVMRDPDGHVFCVSQRPAKFTFYA